MPIFVSALKFQTNSCATQAYTARSDYLLQFIPLKSLRSPRTLGFHIFFSFARIAGPKTATAREGGLEYIKWGQGSSCCTLPLKLSINRIISALMIQ
jgi:hypothetical protein